MRYAWIETGAVVNISEGVPQGAAGTVPLGNRPVAIGDAYTDGAFTRGGEPVLTIEEQLAVAQSTIAELDAALLDAEYENIIGGLGL